ncbi:hypothetical protein KM043_010374 [Ampulex compressa]|nr:hypothetical protein KM043_010374 [Ampulex compressa]
MRSEEEVSKRGQWPRSVGLPQESVGVPPRDPFHSQGDPTPWLRRREQSPAPPHPRAQSANDFHEPEAAHQSRHEVCIPSSTTLTHENRLRKETYEEGRDPRRGRTSIWISFDLRSARPAIEPLGEPFAVASSSKDATTSRGSPARELESKHRLEEGSRKIKDVEIDGLGGCVRNARLWRGRWEGGRGTRSWERAGRSNRESPGAHEVACDTEAAGGSVARPRDRDFIEEQ